jgi:arsenite methyltransferase
MARHERHTFSPCWDHGYGGTDGCALQLDGSTATQHGYSGRSPHVEQSHDVASCWSKPLAWRFALSQALATLQPGDMVLDLGCADGTFSLVAATVVGESGLVIGIESTPEWISQARAKVVQHGYGNVSFRLGELDYLPVADQSVDAIISHGGISQASRNTRVFREAFRTLRAGGHMALVDMIATQVLPEEEEPHDVGSIKGLLRVLMLDDIEDLLRAAGFEQIRIHTRQEFTGLHPVSACQWSLTNRVIPALIEAIKPK